MACRYSQESHHHKMLEITFKKNQSAGRMQAHNLLTLDLTTISNPVFCPKPCQERKMLVRSQRIGLKGRKESQPACLEVRHVTLVLRIAAPVFPAARNPFGFEEDDQS